MANPLRRGGDPVRDIVQTAKAYVKQETIDPLKSIGRYVAYGTIGAVSLGIGTLLGMLALLRFLQYYMHGAMSWAPYLLTVVAGLLVAGLAVSRARAKSS